MYAITFQKGIQTSIVTSKEELIREINHYQAFWLTSVGSYVNEFGTEIKVRGLTHEIRKWLSMRMK